MSGKRKKKEPPQFEAAKPDAWDDNGTLRCGDCRQAVTITITGLLCDCPRIRPHLTSFTEEKRDFPRQFQTSDLDKDTAKLTGATP